MHHFKSIVILLIFVYVKLSKQTKYLTQLKPSEVINKEWIFDPNSSFIGMIEKPNFRDDKYAYIECYVENRSKFCNASIEYRDPGKASMNKMCRFQLNIEESEYVTDLKFMFELMNERTAVFRYTKDQLWEDFDITNLTDNNVRVCSIDMKDCKATDVNIQINARYDNHIITHNDSFDVLAVSFDVPDCQENLCLFKFDSNGTQVGVAKKFLSSDVSIDQLEKFSVYSIDPLSSAKGYYVLVELYDYVQQFSKLELFTAKPDGAKTNVKEILQRYTFSDYKWSKVNDQVMICVSQYITGMINCTVLDRGLNATLSANFMHYVSHYYSYECDVLGGGDILLWINEKIDESSYYNNVYVKSGGTADAGERYFGFRDTACSARRILYASTDVYELEDRICFSAFCYCHDYSLAIVYDWKVKCVNGSAVH